MDALSWLREAGAEFDFDAVAIYRRNGEHEWPLVAENAQDLERKLAIGGHLGPLPKEPAALANVLEVCIVDFLLERASRLEGAVAKRGTERGYPDIELVGPAFGGGHHAVDVKVARAEQEWAGHAKPGDALLQATPTFGTRSCNGRERSGPTATMPPTWTSSPSIGSAQTSATVSGTLS